ncbi:uncharacterized protein LOC131851261 isoform X2 [Achroia grisella]|uniref:uncharacterized protein LOC131851261 isoform X2 n=1 Tax=Achroia grisella TaxID=688607 RepID=UPI0027D2696A|nr:uncharacterized protein LOC131851261 isoform X2 [Achroia grisella]
MTKEPWSLYQRMFLKGHEILQKEENDSVIFDIREEIVEEALRIVYERYMERQNVLFTAHCAAQAWLKLIDWNFYRHDPGEDPSAHPPCFIPKRVESWIPDELPEPSPKDTWSRHELNVVEETADEGLQKWPSNDSLDVPVVEEIPSEYWFPGKINMAEEFRRSGEKIDSCVEEKPLVVMAGVSGVWNYVQTLSESTSSLSHGNLAAESEVLQKVTDYSTEELSQKESTFSALKTTTPVDGSLHGAGDSAVDRLKPKRRHSEKSKLFSRASMLGRSKNALPPLDIGDSRSRISIISDCRLRNLRLETQYEISSEKVDTPPGEIVKRK